MGHEKLDWTGRVLCAEDVRTHLNGRPEIVVRSNTVITPSAFDELRRKGVRIHREDIRRDPTLPRRWAYAQDRSYPIVTNVLQTLEREGLGLEAAPANAPSPACRWARALAQSMSIGSFAGMLAFCEDAGLVCCVANKVAGIRAVAARGPAHCLKATRSLGANFVGIEVAERTYFELKQLVRLICGAGQPSCSGEVGCVIEELEGHADR
jgi:hypothetical protein